MKRKSGSPHFTVFSLRLLVPLVVIMAAPPALYAADSGESTSREASEINPGSNQPLVADNYAAANIGQLKQIASRAFAELQAKAPGGIGSMRSPNGIGFVLQELINGWRTPNSSRDDSATVNLWQLRSVAKLFYDRLIEIGYSQAYPWEDASNGRDGRDGRNGDDDYSLVTIGQLKKLFSFDLTYSSTGSPLPDWWQMRHFGAAGQSPTALAPNGDGLSLLANYQHGIDPMDFYNGVLPTLKIMSGNGQHGHAGRPLAKPLVVAITDNQGDPIPYAPVRFSVTSADGLLAESAGGTGAATLNTIACENGRASIYLQMGSGVDGAGVNTVQVSAMTTDRQTASVTSHGEQAASVTFKETTMAILNPGDARMLVLASGGNSHGDFTIAVKADRTVWGWGSNRLGQLGNGEFTNSATPVQAKRLPPVLAVSAGKEFVAALDQFGRVWTWGDNNYGETGTGMYSAIDRPIQMPGLFNIVSVVTGSYHVLALDSSGKLWAWGRNSYGQLGDGNTANSPIPGKIENLSGVTAAAGGLDVSLALLTNGTVWEWGKTYGGVPAQVSGLPAIVKISAAADDSALALDASAHVWSWARGKAPAQISGLVSITGIRAGIDGAGLALDARGNVWTWPRSGTEPRKVAGLGAASTISLAKGYSLALLPNGNIYGWGTAAELGNLPEESTLMAIQIPSLMRVTAAASGSEHALAVRSDGTVWAWGSNSDGQLGTGGTSDSTAPVQIPALSGATMVAAGASHSLAIVGDGSIYAWGENSLGQLGTGDASGASQLSPAPLQIAGTFVSVSGGTYHSLALDSTGKVWAWGANWHGQLGNGDTSGATQYAPAQVVWTEPEPATAAISAGDSHSLALDSAGHVWAWGLNSSGQLGNADATGVSRYSPVPVFALSNVAAVSAGSAHSLAVDKTGEVWAWGSNTNGQLGNGDATGAAQYAPVRVFGLTHVIAVAAGSDYSLAIKSDGTVWAWGGNQSGQLGNGTTMGSLTPVQTPWLGQAVKVFAGSTSAMVLKSVQTLAAWGSNAKGQLGLGLDGAQVITPEIVLGLNLSDAYPPVAAFLGPASGTVVPIDSRQTIQADWIASSRTRAPIARIEFFQEGVKIGEAHEAPWQMNWTATAGGPVHFSAVATDATGLKSQRVLSTLNVIEDADGDGLPDWWELEFLGALRNNAHAPAPNGDGLSLIANYLRCINPNDYYNGAPPDIDIMDGNYQNGPAGTLLPAGPLTVQITVAGVDVSLADAPVSFTAGTGGGKLAASASGTPASSISVTSDAKGMASVYFWPGGNASSSTQNQVQASVTTGGKTVSRTFTMLGTPSGAPLAPTGFKITGDSPSSLQLTWTNTPTVSSSAATSILVQRQNDDGSWKTVATLDPTATSYVDTGLTTGQIYTYRLIAVNSAGGTSTRNPGGADGDQYSTGNSSPKPPRYQLAPPPVVIPRPDD